MSTTAVTEKSRRFVRMFKPQFAELVRTRKKRQTVRPVPKRMPKVGDFIDARKWSGAPYRSKQEVLQEAIIKKVSTISISLTNHAVFICLDGRQPLFTKDADEFARADGFEDCYSMVEWFKVTHGLQPLGEPFKGIVIYW